MRLRILALSAIGLMLAIGVLPAAAQRTPPRLEFFPQVPAIPATPAMPPMQAIPAMPVLPAMPVIPPIPPLPHLEDFHFENFNLENLHLEGLEHLNFEFSGLHEALEPLQGFAYQMAVAPGSRSQDPEIGLKQEAFRSLLRSNPDRAIEVASERLKDDPGDPVVLASLPSISQSESAKARPLLISIAKTSTNTNARQQAVSAIARNRDDKAALTTLDEIYATASSSVELRRTVVSTIGRMTDASALTILARIAKNDSDVSVRRTAIQSLGSRKEPEAIKLLEDLLKSQPLRG